MPNPEILTSLHGRRLGLGPKNEVIVNDEDRGGDAKAQALIWSIARGQLTSAQILALNATPISVIAAPGAGKAILVHHAEFFLDYNSAGYVAGAGEDLVLRYTNGSGALVTLPVDGADFIDQTADTFAYAPGMIQADDQGLVLTANAAVVAHIQSGEVITGNSPVNYAVYYRVIDSTLPSS